MIATSLQVNADTAVALKCQARSQPVRGYCAGPFVASALLPGPDLLALPGCHRVVLLISGPGPGEVAVLGLNVGQHPWRYDDIGGEVHPGI